jgi:hypothetical protein
MLKRGLTWNGTDAREQVPELTPQQRGAMITNSGKSPIAGLEPAARGAFLQTVLQRALNGERQSDIAQSIGIHQTALSQALLKYCEDEWKDVQVARAWANLEDAEQNLEIAADMLAIARARERLKSAQWQLERLHRRLFGQEQTNQAGQGTININIGIKRDTAVSHVIDSIDVVTDGGSGKAEGGEG